VIFVLTVHLKQGVQEIYLPSVQNRAVSIELNRELLSRDIDVSLSLDVFDSIWTIRPNEYVNFSSPTVLHDGLRVNAKLVKTGEEVVIFVDGTIEKQTIFKKYHTPAGRLITMGSADSNAIRYSTRKLVSGQHFAIETSSAESAVIDKSTNGTFVNGKRISNRQKLHYGDVIYVFGLKLVWLGDILAINNPRDGCEVAGLAPVKWRESAAVENEPPGEDKYYSRSPRLMPVMDTGPVELDAPPGPATRRRQPLWMTIGPSLSMILPMTIGILFTTMAARDTGAASSPFMFMGIFTSVTAAFVGVFWALMSVRHQKKQEAADEENRQERYSKYLDRMEKIIAAKQKKNRASLIAGYPDKEECMNWIVSRDRHLWERNINHPDFLTVRLGIGTVPSFNEVMVPKERFSLIDDDLAERPFKIQKKYEMLTDVPILLSLLENKLIGVIGKKRNDVLSTARIFATELAILHSYTDVRMVFIVPQGEDWSFAKWLPHVWSEDNSIRLIANEPNSIGEVLYHLSGVIRTRSDEDRKKDKNLPHYVVFIGDPDLVEHEAAVKSITDSAQNYGFTTLLFYNRLDRLPNNCTVIVQNDKEYRGFYSLDNAFRKLDDVNFDYVSPEKLTGISRLLSDIKVKEAEGSGAIPQMLTFLDMYKTNDVKSIDIYRNWLENRTYESMKALIGARGGGSPVYLDIHEKYHGPHGLVAGTTGSGKSEMLQTYILSLAVSYHPHEVSFILIDYKGGGMAESFKELTHVAGIITNLGGNQTNRALASIRSEIKRRQAVFNDYKIKHIDDYIELFREGKAGDPMPHLLIIADEFAELKKEQPDFVRELVSASRVGRSLGVHLILATQKPDGVVDEQIWSNTKFRVCLRVADKADSMGMLKHPDAAYITQAGRGFFQVGNDEIFEEFQSGWSGAMYEPDVPYTDERSSEVKMINLWGRPSVLRAGKKKAASSGEKVLQLDAMTGYIGKIARHHDIKAVSNVWLPPLPKTIYLEDLPAIELDRRELSAPIGLLDDPVNQEQRTVAVNFSQNNHMIIASSISGGKTTLLQTILYGLVTSKTPKQVNIYIADYGSRTLDVFSILPHVGGVVLDDNQDRTDKLVALLIKELARRKLHFSSRSIGSFREYSRLYDDVPAIIFAIDNLPAFMENNDKHDDNMIQLAREAASYGIYILGTCTNYSDLRGKLRQNIRFGVGLQLPEKYDYDEVLGNRGEITAEEGCPGRGLIKVESDDKKEPRSLEFQTAMCLKADNEAALNIALAEQFRQIAEARTDSSAARIPQVPGDMSFESFRKYPEVQQAVRSNSLPIGYDVKEATLLSLEPEKLFCYAISGGSRTGKTNMLRLLALQSIDAGHDVILIDISEGQPSSPAKDINATCLTNADQLYDWLSLTIPEFSRRHKMIDQAGGRKFSGTALADEKQMVVLIHDFGAFINTIYSDIRNMYSFFENMVRLGNEHKIAMFACITRDDSAMHSGRPVYTGFISWKEGIHFGGQVDNQRIFDFDISPSERIKKLPAGYGYINTGAGTVMVVTPEV
jgi:S-DNA-T family DNA segregation ATPase FtsK/SpoIIIE